MSDITAARRPIKLGGREFLATRFSDKDISEVDQWLRATYIQNARESLPPNASKEVRAETLDLAMRTAATISMYSEMGARMLGTVDGMAKILYITIRRDHPNETIESLRQLLFDPQNLDTFNEEWAELNLPSDERKPQKKAVKKGAQRKRQEFLRGRKPIGD